MSPGNYSYVRQPDPISAHQDVRVYITKYCGGQRGCGGYTALGMPLPHQWSARNFTEGRMKAQPFGILRPVSALTLGGGGLGMVWGPTTFDECVATVHAAVAAGINLLDLAPRYGDGKAEEVVGAAFSGRLPDGVRVTSKCNLGEPPADQIEAILRRSIEASLRRLRLSRLDLFFLHSNVVPDAEHISAVARGRRADDDLPHLCRSCPSGLRAVRCRGIDRRLGPHGHRPSRDHYQAARRAPGAGSGAVHRQSARLAGRPQILRRAGAAARR